MFDLVKINDGRINQPEPEFLPVGTTPVSKGTALVLTSGKLTVAGATVKPIFIAMADGAANEVIPACRVLPEQLWETTFSANGSGTLPIGSKVTTLNGLQVTATTASGVATVVDLLGEADAVVDNRVFVRFE